MIGYASVTRTKKNLAALRSSGWRILITPENPKPPDGFQFAIDNGAWGYYQRSEAFDAAAFERLIERYGGMADFVIAPDMVAGGMRSLEFSLKWLPKLRHFRRSLLPLQDGMHPSEVSDVLRSYSGCGLFLGGSTEFKLREMYSWGMLACACRRYYHVGRVNTARRIRLAAEAGADSFDGTSASRYAVTVPLLDAARSQPSLLVPALAI